MSTIQGMLSGKQLQTLIEGEEIDTIMVVFPDMYGRFMGKRFDAEFFLKIRSNMELMPVIIS